VRSVAFRGTAPLQCRCGAPGPGVAAVSAVPPAAWFPFVRAAYPDYPSGLTAADVLLPERKARYQAVTIQEARPAGCGIP